MSTLAGNARIAQSKLDMKEGNGKTEEREGLKGIRNGKMVFLNNGFEPENHRSILYLNISIHIYDCYIAYVFVCLLMYSLKLVASRD